MARSGRLARAGDPRAQRWLIPLGVNVTGDGVTYDRAATLGAGREGAPGEGDEVLTAFRRLTRVRDLPAAVTAFVGEFGVLGLCAHGHPSTACPVADGIDNPAGFEALDAWRTWAERADDTLVVADAVKRGDTPPRAAVVRLREYVWAGWDEGAPLRGDLVALGRDAVAGAVTKWLRDADAGLVLTWGPNLGAPSLQVGAPVPDAGVLAVLAYELAATVALAGATPRAWVCDECGRRFTPRGRKPREGIDPRTGERLRIYCPRCREGGAPQRRADQRQTERRRRTRAAERGA